ncbi:MAG: DUF4328 domain-containing protein [Dehalococcoidia bacterium]|nr:DUF4328 domain-containing protein [Dehalococcoidia bacterium]
MVCSHCGTDAPEGSGFCVNCGRGLFAADQAPEAERLPAAAAAPNPPLDAVLPTTGTSPVPGSEAARWSEAASKPFRYGDAWYQRSDGTTYRWNSANSAWAPEMEGQLPFFMRRPGFTSLRTPAIWLCALFGVFALLTLVAAISDVLYFAVYDDIANGEFVKPSDIDSAETFFNGMKGFQSLVVVGIVPFFLWWTRRATCNVRALGAAAPEFGPGWAIGWWFVPFANWVQPVRVLNQAWRASDPGLPAAETDGWRRTRLTPLLPIWWVAYQVVSAVWTTVWGSIDPKAMDDRDIANLTSAVALLDVLMLGITGLTIWVVFALTRRQDQANARFDIRGGSSPS